MSWNPETNRVEAPIALGEKSKAQVVLRVPSPTRHEAACHCIND